MNNPFCKPASLQYEYENTLFCIEFTCNEIIMKRKGVVKPIVLKRADNDCWICTSHYVIEDRERTVIRFKKNAYFLYHFTYGFFKNMPLKKLKNKLLRHICDNSRCCNPCHLIIGTHDENMRDMVERERSCRGEDHPNVKLTEDIVRAILTSELPAECLADIYNVSLKTVWDVLGRKTWKHVQVEENDDEYTFVL